MFFIRTSVARASLNHWLIDVMPLVSSDWLILN